MNAEAAALLAEIDVYCERTRTSEQWLGNLALNHPGFVALLRKRGWLQAETAAVIRQVMASYPNGIPETEMRRRSLLGSLSERTRQRAFDALAAAAAKDAAEAMPRVHRDPCPRCGARGDIGCGHSQARLVL